MKKVGLSLLCCINLFMLFGQVPSNPLGLNPTSLKWSQINTDKVQVIFPNGLESQSQRVANIVHRMWDRPQESIGEKREKVSIILHNQTTISNGFVTVGPFRSEFYMMPPQFDITTDWVDLLAIHEYRHVMQFANANRGITKLVRTILGSWAWGGMFSTVLPRWFFEGDAVDMETKLTASGRGRFPSFNMQYRSLVLENKLYNYEKASAGSLKDFVPSWYPLGYYLTTHARERFGEDIWEKVVTDAVQYKGLFFPFSRSLKNHTGLGTKELYAKTRSSMDSLWKQEATLRENTEDQSLNTTPKNTIIHYNNPIFLEDGRTIVQKRGFDRIAGYYMLEKDGSEKRLTEPGILLDRDLSTLSQARDILCWSEAAFHPRWGNKNYSNIKIYDIQSGLKRKITSQSRLFSPALSSDAEKIAAVRVSTNLSYEIVIIDVASGEIVHTIPNSENLFYSHPKWTDEGNKIVAVAKAGEKHALKLIDIETGESESLIDFAGIPLSHPFPHGDRIYFSAGFQAVNNIFVYDRSNATVYQVTNSRLGAFQPSVSPDGQKLAYSDFSSGGYNVKSLVIDEDKWQPVRFSESNDQFYKPDLSNNRSILQNLPSEQFVIKKFNKLSGLFNPHSVLPVLEPPIVGGRILSDNKFSTLSSEAGAFYNLNENEWTLIGSLSYAELFPIINVDYRRANRSANFFLFDQIGDTTITTTLVAEEWTENNISGGVSIPLNLSQGNFLTAINLSANYHYIQTNSDNLIDGPAANRDTANISEAGIDQLSSFFLPPLRDEKLHALDLQFTFSSLKRRAIQNLNPRLGFFLDARYRTLFNSGPFEGDVLTMRGLLYLPGFFRNHSFYLSGGYQRSKFLDNYKFSNLFFYPRGYDSFLSDEVFRIGFNYSLPLWYPDLAIGPLAFIKRIKANFFFDYGDLKTGFPFDNNDFLNGSMTSTGVELRFDVRAIRLVDIDFGVRYSYLFERDYAPGRQQHQFDFLLISIR